jgi:Coenzyme PQQ synthesis protein D (PqqD)
MRIEKSSQTVFTPLADGTGVLLNLETLLYYRLNRTAALLWQEVESGTCRTLDDLVQRACEKFDVDDQRASESLGEFLTRLAEFKMIRLT